MLLNKCSSDEQAYCLCVQTFFYLLLLEANCICFHVILMQLGIMLIQKELEGAKMDCNERSTSDRLSNCHVSV